MASAKVFLGNMVGGLEQFSAEDRWLSAQVAYTKQTVEDGKVRSAATSILQTEWEMRT